MTSFESELVAEAARKSSVAWVSAGGAACAVWHAWDDGVLYFVAGGAEPPVDGIESSPEATVWLRSADTHALLVSVRASVHVLAPSDPAWERAVQVLAPKALNTSDRSGRVAAWMESSRLVRLEPHEIVSAPPGA